jgi:hypothetical protein
MVVLPLQQRPIGTGSLGLRRLAAAFPTGTYSSPGISPPVSQSPASMGLLKPSGSCRRLRRARPSLQLHSQAYPLPFHILPNSLAFFQALSLFFSTISKFLPQNTGRGPRTQSFGPSVLLCALRPKQQQTMHFTAFFCTLQNPIPRLFINFHTLCRKTPGGGCARRSSLATFSRTVAPRPAKCQDSRVAFFATRGSRGSPPGNNSAPSGV